MALTSLPDELKCLEKWIPLGEGMVDKRKQKKIWRKLRRNDRSELGTAFDIANSVHGRATLEAWHAIEGGDPEYPGDRFVIRCLLIFFDYLSERGIKPFSNASEPFVTFGPVVGPPGDWTSLDARLEFIIPALEDYGQIFFEGDMVDRIESMPEDEYEDLKSLLRRIDENDLGEVMASWCDEHKESHTTESDRMENFMLFLDFVGAG